MRFAAALIGLLILAACGADGPPKPPADQPGVTVTGQVKVGVAGS